MNWKQIGIYGFFVAIGLVVGMRLTAPDLLISAAVNGITIAIGMIIGTRMTAKSMRKEIDDVLETSETLQLLKTTLMEQMPKASEFVEKASKVFDQAAEVLGGEGAKNFFVNLSRLIEQLAGKPNEKILKVPHRNKKQ